MFLRPFEEIKLLCKLFRLFYIFVANRVADQEFITNRNIFCTQKGENARFQHSNEGKKIMDTKDSTIVHFEIILSNDFCLLLQTKKIFRNIAENWITFCSKGSTTLSIGQLDLQLIIGKKRIFLFGI